MAGLWETWGPKESPQKSYTMITTEANAIVGEFNPTLRMPVVLEQEDYDLWLTGTPEQASILLRTYPAEKMNVSQLTTTADETRGTLF